MAIAKWTGNEISDQRGRVIFITGANSGIGYETTRALAKKGAKVIMACRDLNKANEAKANLQREISYADLIVLELDLADLDSIHKSVQTFEKSFDKLDVLINNAGVMATPYSKTKQGFEMQIGTNFFGHFVLTGLLLPLLSKVPGSRIVTLSSLGARFGKLDFEDIMSEHKKYNKMNAYSQAKLANLVFALELARRLKNENSTTLSIAVHPGGSPTNLQRTSGFIMKDIITPLLSQSPDKAALPSLRAACDPEMLNGTFWGPTGFLELKGYPDQVKIPRLAKDTSIGRQLWALGEKLTGIYYPKKEQRYKL
jgi:NAD(P)-dependent dehydrogenase (short-subunit alcohol dehydrogenase family)